jgi:hypothetical protein
MDKIFKNLIKQYPNDMELGKEIRKLYVKTYVKKDSETPKIKSHGIQ